MDSEVLKILDGMDSKVLKILDDIVKLDISQQAYLMSFLSDKIRNNIDTLQSELNTKKTCIRLALKINKNETVANLLEEDE